MSYCRWSNDDWTCDIYAYEAEDGFTVHVAANRYTSEIPHLPSFYEVSNDEWFEAYQAQMKAVETSEKKKIGGKYDGKIFIYDTLEEFLNGIADIRSHGYNVPEYVFERQ
jgi:hypothetical protein